jgi:oxaloacetate decarboxylase alpha subunit
MDRAVTERPADLIPNEFERIAEEAKAAGGNGSVEDALTYAMFPKVAPRFFTERSRGPTRFEATAERAPGVAKSGSYVIAVNGTDYTVESRPSGAGLEVNVNGKPYAIAFKESKGAVGKGGAGSAEQDRGAIGNVPASGIVKAPVAGTLLKHVVPDGDPVALGQTILIVESMKMELEIKAPSSGRIRFLIAPGSQILSGQHVAEIL